MSNKEISKYSEHGRIPKQFNSKLEVIEDVPIVAAEIAEKMNEEYRRNCIVHDVIEIESQIASNSIYAEA